MVIYLPGGSNLIYRNAFVEVSRNSIAFQIILAHISQVYSGGFSTCIT